MAAARIQSTHVQKVLNKLQYQGYTNNCGPTTTATVINALRQAELKGPELADQMNRVAWRGFRPVIRRIPNSATLPWGMVDIFQKHGLRASWRALTRTCYLFEGLARGDILMPIIGSLKPVSGHVMTLVAWDVEQGWGFANTAYEDKDIFWESDPRFQKTWGTFEKSWGVFGRLLVEVKRPQAGGEYTA